MGLDDNWQACGKGTDSNFHDGDGNPILNTDRFPDMAGMVRRIHQLGLLAGWYMNNCICAEHKDNSNTPKFYLGDANAVLSNGFDEVKLDGCGPEMDLNQWPVARCRLGILHCPVIESFVLP